MESWSLALSPHCSQAVAISEERPFPKYILEAHPTEQLRWVLKAPQDGPSSHQETPPTMGSQPLPPTGVHTW